MHPRITEALERHPRGLPPFFGKTKESDFWSLVSENTVAPAESLLLRQLGIAHQSESQGENETDGRNHSRL